jgi:hypothetical protein
MTFIPEFWLWTASEFWFWALVVLAFLVWKE